MLLKYRAACIAVMIRHEVKCPISSTYWRTTVRRAIVALAEEGF